MDAIINILDEKYTKKQVIRAIIDYKTKDLEDYQIANIYNVWNKEEVVSYIISTTLFPLTKLKETLVNIIEKKLDSHNYENLDISDALKYSITNYYLINSEHQYELMTKDEENIHFIEIIKKQLQTNLEQEIAFSKILRKEDKFTQDNEKIEKRNELTTQTILGLYASLNDLEKHILLSQLLNL